MIPEIAKDMDNYLNGASAKLTEDITLGMVYKYDFELGDFIILDGRPVMCTPEEAVKQWAELCIRTPFDKYKVYEGTDFGCSIAERLINHKSLPADYVNSVVYADLSEKLLMHKSITGIQNFKITNVNGIAEISFTLITTLGTIEGGASLNVI